jgi:hypothetical protein
MTVTLELKPKTHSGLLALAKARGLSLEEFLLAMVEDTVPAEPSGVPSPEARAAAFEAWSANHPYTPPLSDYAISRESMYERA